MAGIVGLTELQHTSGNSAMTIDTSGNLTIKTGTTTVKGEGSNNTNLQQGLAKQWVLFQQKTSNVVHDSFNTSSVTDGGTAIIQPNFTNNMTGASYFAIADHHNNNASGAGSRYGQVVDTAASGVTIATGRSNNTFVYEEDGSDTEPGCHTMGDLA